jgi:hypothetical protein
MAEGDRTNQEALDAWQSKRRDAIDAYTRQVAGYTDTEQANRLNVQGQNQLAEQTAAAQNARTAAKAAPLGELAYADVYGKAMPGITTAQDKLAAATAKQDTAQSSLGVVEADEKLARQMKAEDDRQAAREALARFKAEADAQKARDNNAARLVQIEAQGKNRMDVARLNVSEAYKRATLRANTTLQGHQIAADAMLTAKQMGNEVAVQRGEAYGVDAEIKALDGQLAVARKSALALTGIKGMRLSGETDTKGMEARQTEYENYQGAAELLAQRIAELQVKRGQLMLPRGMTVRPIQPRASGGAAPPPGSVEALKAAFRAALGKK